MPYFPFYFGSRTRTSRGAPHHHDPVPGRADAHDRAGKPRSCSVAGRGSTQDGGGRKPSTGLLRWWRSSSESGRDVSEDTLGVLLKDRDDIEVGARLSPATFRWRGQGHADSRLVGTANEAQAVGQILLVFDANVAGRQVVSGGANGIEDAVSAIRRIGVEHAMRDCGARPARGDPLSARGFRHVRGLMRPFSGRSGRRSQARAAAGAGCRHARRSTVRMLDRAWTTSRLDGDRGTTSRATSLSRSRRKAPTRSGAERISRVHASAVARASVAWRN